MRSPLEAAALAESGVGTHDADRIGMCLRITRLWYPVDALWSDAATAWRHTDFKHPGEKDAPVGVPFFWTGGPNGYGHTAISVGGGYCVSTDYPRRGYLGRVRVDTLSRGWSLSFQGWAEDINERRIWTPQPVPPPSPPGPEPTRPLPPAPSPRQSIFYPEEDEMKKTSAIASWDGQRVDLFIIEADTHRLKTKGWDGEHWGSWHDLGGWSREIIGIVSRRPGHYEVYVVGQDEGVYQIWYDNGWQHWVPLEGKVLEPA
jgi:hypothetical protein